MQHAEPSTRVGRATHGAPGWTRLRYQLAFIAFVRPGTLLRLAPYLREIDLRYVPRLLLIIALSLAAQPLRLVEAMAHGRRIARTPIERPPVFIIGHWRSGTTHLHNLLSQDPSFGYVSMYQAIAPDCSMVGRSWLKPLLSRLLPARRPMDNVTWATESPQEEEVPLAKICPYAYYAYVLFPRCAGDLFKRRVLLENAPGRAAADFASSYRRILQIATLQSGGRQLILKNPVNTARVRMLLELFPDAKFVHIHRSPYDVFASTRNLHDRIMAFTSLQNFDSGVIMETVYVLYEAMMRRFFEDRALIPEGNLIEVRFEDLERDPLGEVRRVYQGLGLAGFAEAEPALRRYVASQDCYSKNRFELTAADRERIARRWAFAFAELGYSSEPSES